MSKLYQQNKNICQKIINRTKACLPKTPREVGDLRIHLKVFYDMRMRLIISVKYEDMVWEESDGNLFLLARPILYISNFDTFWKYAGAVQGSITAILKDNFEQKILANNSDSTLDKILKDGNCTLEELKKYCQGNDSDLESHFYDVLKEIAQELMELKIYVKAHPRLYPHIQDRTKIPICILDPHNRLINFIYQSYGSLKLGKNVVNSEKAREELNIDNFFAHLSRTRKDFWNRIPLENWLKYSVQNSNLLSDTPDISWRLYI